MASSCMKDRVLCRPVEAGRILDQSGTGTVIRMSFKDEFIVDQF